MKNQAEPTRKRQLTVKGLMGLFTFGLSHAVVSFYLFFQSMAREVILSHTNESATMFDILAEIGAKILGFPVISIAFLDPRLAPGFWTGHSTLYFVANSFLWTIGVCFIFRLADKSRKVKANSSARVKPTTKEEAK